MRCSSDHHGPDPRRRPARRDSGQASPVRTSQLTTNRETSCATKPTRHRHRAPPRWGHPEACSEAAPGMAPTAWGPRRRCRAQALCLRVETVWHPLDNLAACAPVKCGREAQGRPASQLRGNRDAYAQYLSTRYALGDAGAGTDLASDLGRQESPLRTTGRHRS